MSHYEIRQFKLATGEEIVCEVVQWQNEEELELIVRKAMKLVVGDLVSGTRYYSFRPWMIYQENPDDLIVLNGNHVVGIGYPTDMLLEQFNSAVDEMHQLHIIRTQEHKEKSGSASTSDVNKMTKEIQKASLDIEEYLRLLKEEQDSDMSNIITFPGNSEIH